jgi:hypothetical protein
MIFFVELIWYFGWELVSRMSSVYILSYGESQSGTMRIKGSLTLTNSHNQCNAPSRKGHECILAGAANHFASIDPAKGYRTALRVTTNSSSNRAFSLYKYPDIRGRGKEIKDVPSHAELKGAFPERTGMSEGCCKLGSADGTTDRRDIE